MSMSAMSRSLQSTMNVIAYYKPTMPASIAHRPTKRSKDKDVGRIGRTGPVRNTLRCHVIPSLSGRWSVLRGQLDVP